MPKNAYSISQTGLLENPLLWYRKVSVCCGLFFKHEVEQIALKFRIFFQNWSCIRPFKILVRPINKNRVLCFLKHDAVYF